MAGQKIFLKYDEIVECCRRKILNYRYISR
jgi:hypothetical protein